MATNKQKSPRRRRNAAGHRAAKKAISVDELIQVYKQHFSKGRREELLRYNQKNIDFSKALELAALGRVPKENYPNEFTKEPHQQRLKNSDLRAGYRLLKRLPPSAWDGPSFESLHFHTKKIAQRCSGLGEMWAFDTAFRLSIFFECLPSDLYLHAGCRVGARKLVGISSESSMPSSRFGRQLRKLGIPYLESFLCTMKDYLKPGMLS